MKRWPTKPLGEVLEISRERIEPTEHPDTFFNYVGLESIEGHTGELLSYQPTRGAEIKSTKNVFHNGEILYGKLRPYLNKVHIAGGDGICSTDIYVLRPRQREINASFAAYYLRSPSVLSVVSNAMTGANLPRISQDALLSIKAPVPRLEEQERIVKLLDEGDELRKLRPQADNRSDGLIPAIFHEMFGDPSANLSRWEIKELKSVCIIGDGNHSSNYPKASEMLPTGIPFIRAANLQDGGLDDTDMRFISPEKHQNLKKGHLKSGDVLFSNRGEIGKLAIVPKEFDNSNLNSQLAWLRPKEMLLPEYLFSLLASDFYQAGFGRAQQGAALQQFTIRQLSEVKALVPPLALQNEFAQWVKEIRELETEQATSRTCLDALFQSMLHRAFSGEV